MSTISVNNQPAASNRLQRHRSLSRHGSPYSSRTSVVDIASNVSAQPRTSSRKVQKALRTVRFAFNRGNPFLKALVPGLYTDDWRTPYPGRGARVLTLTSSLGASIDARWYPATKPGTELIFVAFPGNGDTADSMDPAWQALRGHAHILVINAPGYGESDAPSDRTQIELHMMANVQAVQRYLANDKAFAPAKCVWFGYSLGGSQAVMGYAKAPGSHLILENTFTSARDVVASVVGKTLGTTCGGALTNALARSSLPVGVAIENVEGETDGLDTRRKLERVANAGAHYAAGSQVHVFVGGRDKLMPATFGGSLLEAYRGSSETENLLEAQRLAYAARGSLYIDPEGVHAAGEDSLLRVVDQVSIILENIADVSA